MFIIHYCTTNHPKYFVLTQQLFIVPDKSLCQLDSSADLAEMGLRWASLCISSQLTVLVGQQGDWIMCFHHSAGQSRLAYMVAASFKERVWKHICLLGSRLRIGTFPLLVNANHKASSNSKEVK